MTIVSDPGPEEFLAGLSERDRTELVGIGRHRRWPAGGTLFTEGDRSTSVVVVLAGRAKVFSLTEQGEQVVLAVCGPGALLGELSALDGAPRSASVGAIEPLEGLVVPVAVFVEFLRQHPEASVALIRSIVGRLRDADLKRIEFGAFDILGRVASRLVELTDRFGEPSPDGIRITLPLSQDELAGWVGGSREAVSKALRILRDRGYLTTARRAMTIRDVDAVRRLAGLDPAG
jgi:CRP/FNR family transcriptional regulator, cyclic AMP receptor protein